MIHRLYRVLTQAGGPLIRAYLNRRRQRGKEDALRFPERHGIAGRPRPAGPLVWLHGASVGESLSLLPLIERLAARPGLSLLVTTGTVTSARLLAERLPAQAAHQYIPVDRPPWVKRFLDHWRPDLALWAESDFWPNMLDETGRRRIPLILVQGRVSPRSFRGWCRMPRFIRRVLSNFTLCLAQTEGDAQHLRRLGARDVRCLGNLKLSVPPLPCDEVEFARLAGLLHGRPVWLAASTHPGEEAIAADVHQRLAATHPRLLTVIAPRHPTRGDEVSALIRAAGLTVAQRSHGQAPAPDTAVFVADTLGEMGLLFRLAPIVFMGKSLTAEGGQNPFEPACLGATVLFGPRMSNFPDMVPALLASGGGEAVADAVELADAVARLLDDPALLNARRNAAQAWTKAEAGALDSVAAALDPFLIGAEARHARS